MDFPAILQLSVNLAVNLVNTLTPGGVRGVTFELPSDVEARRNLVLKIPPVEGDTRAADDIDLEASEALLKLAGLLRPIFEAGSLDDAGQLINDLLVRYEAAPILVQEDTRWRLHFHSPMVGIAAARGAGAATALAVLIDSGQFERIGVCEARNCDRVYFDVSRNARKRFCSTACNNRTKMATFRERQNSAAAA